MKKMKNTVHNPFCHLATVFLILISAMLASCQKSPINGDLDGQWQVMDVQPAFYLHTCQLTYYGDYFTTGNFRHADGKLTLDFPHANSQDKKMILRQYGINTNPVSFTVVRLDKKNLILRDGETTVTLRKF